MKQVSFITINDEEDIASITEDDLKILTDDLTTTSCEETLNSILYDQYESYYGEDNDEYNITLFPVKASKILNQDVINNIINYEKSEKTRDFINKHTVKKKYNVFPSKNERTGYNILLYLLEQGMEFSLIDGNPYMYCEYNGVWYCLQTREGFEQYLLNLPEKVKKEIDNDKLHKVIQNIKTCNNIESRSLDSDDNMRYLINFVDGVYDIRTGTISKHSSKYTFLYCLQAYASDISETYSDASLLNSYLDNSFDGDPVKIQTLSELLGVALSTIRDQKIAFFLYGKGNGGKTVMLNLLSKLFGNEFYSSISFEQIQDKFSSSLLQGKWINICGEMSELTKNRLMKFKTLVGNDPIVTSFKGKDGFVLRNQALFMFACNDMPSVNKYDQAYLNRLRLLEYNISVPKEKQIPHLDDRLFNEEIGAVLKFAIDGLRSYIDNGLEITYKSESDEVAYRTTIEENSFMQFATDFICYSDGAFMKYSEIDIAYTRYCKQNGYTPLNSTKISGILNSMFNTCNDRKGKNRDRGYINLKLIYPV